MGKVAVIGLGDMGSGLAKNLLKAGFEVTGFDPDPARATALDAMGGRALSDAAAAAERAEAAFVMVMNGAQAEAAIFGSGGLSATLPKDAAIILTATIKPAEARALGERLAADGRLLIDSPVSGGYGGAQGGTLTMMAAAPSEVLDRFAPVMEAVSTVIHRVGAAPGMGQTVKACLQTLIGSIFSATFEASALAAKAGVDAEALYKVVSTSGAGCGCANTALGHVIAGEFERTGSHINTMHKDLTIALDLAEQLLVPMQTASAAMQIFHAGKAQHPEGDNWACAKVIEGIVGAELRKGANP